MAKLRERREARQAGLLGTAFQTPGTTTTGSLTDPEAPALRMPDPADPVRGELLKGLLMKKLRGGRRSTILSPLLRGIMGTNRTARTESPGI